MLKPYQKYQALFFFALLTNPCIILLEIANVSLLKIGLTVLILSILPGCGIFLNPYFPENFPLTCANERDAKYHLFMTQGVGIVASSIFLLLFGISRYAFITVHIINLVCIYGSLSFWASYWYYQEKPMLECNMYNNMLKSGIIDSQNEGALSVIPAPVAEIIDISKIRR